MTLKQVTLERTAYVPDQLILTGLMQVAFAGRSNVGKSSLLNKLFNRRNLAKVSQTPGKTQSINYYNVDDQYYLVDLPGYGFARAPKSERDRWQQMMEHYFVKNKALYAIAHLIDIRHEPTDLDLMLHEWTRPLVKEHLYVLTKADKLAPSKRVAAAKQLQSELKVASEQVVVFSTELGDGKQRILEWIRQVRNLAQETKRTENNT